MSALSSTAASPQTSRPSSPASISPRDITSPEQIATQLALLARREADLSIALNALLADRGQVEGALSHLRELGSEVGHLVAEIDGQGPSRLGAGAVGVSSRGLGLQNAEDVFMEERGGLLQRVEKVWETSERVGGKVRRLDEEVGRVREATDIVTEVLELKNALQTMSSTIAKQDWESASRACKRAMSIRKDVLDGGFAGGVVPTPQSPLPPPQQLEELRSVLLHTFRTEFDAAAARKDEQGVSRFFRLWPGIGAEEEGLEAYGDFVVGLVRNRGKDAGKPSSPLYYLTTLTSLLESIAHIIDQHQPVVDKYYGRGRMRTVVERLIGEGDRVVRGMVEGWEEDRRVGRLISETKQSKFPLTSNPALLPPLYPSLVPPASSLSQFANPSALHNLPNLQTASTLLQSYAPGAKRPTNTPVNPPLPQSASTTNLANDEEEGPDPRDVDKVLGELVALGGRWALFRRFVWSRIVEDEAEEHAEGDEIAKPDLAVQGGLDVVEQSASQRAIENLLKVYYEPLELWFLRMSLEKAHRLDSPDTSTRPHVSSILDDTFYLLRTILNRVLSSGSIPTLRSMKDRVVEVMDRDYAGVIKRRMENVFSGSAAILAEKDGRDKREREMRSCFIIYLNDLDVSADYMDRLLDETVANLPQVFIETEVETVKDTLNSLRELSTTFRNAAKTGLDQLFNQLTRPRLRAILDDCYKDVTYLLDDDTFAEADEQDLVRKRFIRSWEGLMDGYRDAFTDHNYQTIFNMTVEVLVRPWEKMVINMRFTELGAIRYDRDIRAAANYLSTQTSFGGARDKFTRLQQIATVLNLDADEDPEDFYSNSGIPWRISRNEYNSIIDQRQ